MAELYDLTIAAARDLLARGEITSVELTQACLDRIVAVDLKAVWLGIKYAVQVMMKAGSGSIVNTASAAQCNLTAILGRTAAYRKHSVTWEEMMRDGEKFDAGIQE